MRTTVTIDDDIATEVERLRRDGLGVSEAINRLARAGLARPEAVPLFRQRSFPMGLKIDVTNIGEVEALLDDLG